MRNVIPVYGFAGYEVDALISSIFNHRSICLVSSSPCESSGAARQSCTIAIHLNARLRHYHASSAELARSIIAEMPGFIAKAYN